MSMRARLVVGLFVLTAMLSLTPPAGAVLPGTNGRIVGIRGPAFGNTQFFLRSVTSSTGAGGTVFPVNTGLAQQHRHPTWSPDRTKIAFAHGPGAGPFDIYTLDLTTPGATAVNITNTPGVSEDRPAWSPDGTRIAWEAGPEPSDIIVRPLAGGPDVNMTSTLAIKAWKPAWTPDSQTLYYSVGDRSVPPNGNTNDVKIFRQPADNSSAGTQFHAISGAHVMQPSLSPDGTRLCYTSSTAPGNTATANVFVAPVNNPGGFTVINTGNTGSYNCTWSPDGTLIAYAEDYAGNGEVWMRRADGTGVAVNLTNAPGLFDGNPDWAPDGRPECPDRAVSTAQNTPVTFDVECTDTGPAYERTAVKDTRVTQPARGTVTQPAPDAPYTYTPPNGFSGTVSFDVRSFDEFAFGTDRGTVTITVRPPVNNGGGGGNGGGNNGVINGTPGDDTLNGTAGNDVINCGAGNDVVNAGGGDDTINCGDGNDRIDGGDGDDQISGDAGNDRAVGGAGNDRIRGGSGRDRMGGGSGNDRVSGGSGADRVSGDSGNDRVDADSGNDVASGGRGKDRVNGGRGNDRVSGSSGNDRLTGGSGRDRLSGGSGRDRVAGGSGRDRLTGGSGRDRCNGNSGRDGARTCEVTSGIP